MKCVVVPVTLIIIYLLCKWSCKILWDDILVLQLLSHSARWVTLKTSRRSAGNNTPGLCDHTFSKSNLNQWLDISSAQRWKCKSSAEGTVWDVCPLGFSLGMYSSFQTVQYFFHLLPVKTEGLFSLYVQTCLVLGIFHINNICSLVSWNR